MRIFLNSRGWWHTRHSESSLITKYALSSSRFSISALKASNYAKFSAIFAFSSLVIYWSNKAARYEIRSQSAVLSSQWSGICSKIVSGSNKSVEVFSCINLMARLSYYLASSFAFKSIESLNSLYFAKYFSSNFVRSPFCLWACMVQNFSASPNLPYEMYFSIAKSKFFSLTKSKMISSSIQVCF